MAPSPVAILWPDGRRSSCSPGSDWLEAARQAGVSIPTGCLGGSCGACEIEVNGQLVRACVATVPPQRQGELEVAFAVDPHW
jgi:ferredoxin